MRPSPTGSSARRHVFGEPLFELDLSNAIGAPRVFEQSPRPWEKSLLFHEDPTVRLDVLSQFLDAGIKATVDCGLVIDAFVSTRKPLCPATPASLKIVASAEDGRYDCIRTALPNDLWRDPWPQGAGVEHLIELAEAALAHWHRAANELDLAELALWLRAHPA